VVGEDMNGHVGKEREESIKECMKRVDLRIGIRMEKNFWISHHRMRFQYSVHILEKRKSII